MKTLKTTFTLIAVLAVLVSCDRKEDDVIDPRLPEDFPIVIILSDELDGDYEDNDEVGIGLEILPVWDPVSRSIDGIIPTPGSDLRVHFEVFDPQDFSSLGDYITGGFAVYEIDDCTDSSDEDIDLDFTFDSSTGAGSFIWPAGVAELEVVLEVNDALFDDDAVNSDLRGFSFRLTSIEGPGTGSDIKLNSDIEFQYVVLDEEVLFGEWELDQNDTEQFARFIALFGSLNEDLQDISAEDIDAIEVNFDYEKMEIKVILVETEEDECEPGELVNLEIEIEAEYSIDFEDLFGTDSGELEFEGEAEMNDVPLEFVLEGSYLINADGTLTITLSGELDGDEIEEQTITLTR